MTQQLNLAGARLDEDISAFDPSAPVRNSQTVGQPWSEDKNTKVLDRLKNARVQPHLIQVEVRDTKAQIDLVSPELITCVGLTKDESGYKLAFSEERNEFVLIQRTNESSWRTMNIWGDAVGCYAAM